MRVLHINNVGNISVYLRNAQRRMGHESIVVQTHRPYLALNYPEDYRFYGDGGAVGKTLFAAELVRKGRWADIIHVHGNFPLRGLKLFSLLGRPIVLHFHGTEVRSGLWRAMARYGDHLFLSTPDLSEWCPEGQYIPNAYEDPGLRAAPANPTIRIVNAHMEREDIDAVKGTPLIQRAIEKLGPPAEWVEVSGLPHALALREYATCTIAVDQLYAGWYGLFATECMTMGLPTLASIRPEWREETAIYSVDADSLLPALRELAEDSALRQKIGREQRRFALHYHDANRIAKEIMKVYERLTA